MPKIEITTTTRDYAIRQASYIYVGEETSTFDGAELSGRRVKVTVWAGRFGYGLLPGTAEVEFDNGYRHIVRKGDLRLAN